MSRVYETAVKIGATITKAFRGDTLNAAAALTKLTKATQNLKAAEKAAAAFKKLDGELTRSKSRYDTATAALRKLEEAEKAAGGATAESTKWRKAGEREVAKAARQLDRATTAAGKNAEALRRLGVDTSKVTSEQERLTRALAATERQQKALEHYEHARERLFGKRKEKTPLIEKAGEQFRGIGESVLHLTEGALVAGEAMHLLVEKTMHAGAEVGESAERIGIGARALQELRYGARQSGAEVEDLDRGLAKMAMNIGHYKILKPKGAGAGLVSIPGFSSLATGTGGGASSSTIDPFKQIGLSAKALSSLKPEDQIKKIADGMAKLKTHAERAYIAQEIFGKGATALLPYLAEGSAGIDKLSKSANKYGAVLSDESVAAAIEAEKTSREMDGALAGLANTLGSVLLPTAVKAFKGISSWIGANRGEVKKWAEGAAKWIEDRGLPAFKSAALEVQNLAGKVLWLVEGAAKLTGGFGNLALILVGLRLAPVAVSLGKIGIEGFKAAAAILKYVAAKKAAAALGGGIDGIGNPSAWAKAGGAIGVAASAAMVTGAAAVGYAIGTYLDRKYDISGGLEKGTHILTTKDEDLNVGDRAAKHSAWSLVKGLWNGNVGQVAVDAQRKFATEQVAALRPKVPSTNAGAVTIAPVYHIGGVASRDDLGKKIDLVHAAGKRKALEEYDKREAHRKRVSFGR